MYLRKKETERKKTLNSTARWFFFYIALLSFAKVRLERQVGSPRRSVLSQYSTGRGREKYVYQETWNAIFSTIDNY